MVATRTETIDRRRDRPTTSGMVIRTESGFHRVLTDGAVVVCRSPKRLLRGDRKATTAVVIGDYVRVAMNADGTGSIEEILERENELVRGMAGGGRYLDVIAANLDTLVAVHSFREPELNFARLDRFVLIAEAAEIPAIIVLNKCDLGSAQETAAAGATYRSVGYPVILASARELAGVDELREALTGKISAVVGPSGVGKSTLLNSVQAGLALRTARISESTGKGRHTTTTAELLQLSGGGWVADTPGLRELAIREVELEDVAWLFPEFRAPVQSCRFSTCTHREEVDCAVRELVQLGGIAASRYRSYLRVYAEIEERPRH